MPFNRTDGPPSTWQRYRLDGPRRHHGRLRPDWGPFAPAAAEVAHELGVEEERIPVQALAGSVLGQRHGFELATQDGVWAAVATCRAFAITIEGRGEPPTRLDLELHERSQD